MFLLNFLARWRTVKWHLLRLIVLLIALLREGLLLSWYLLGLHSCIVYLIYALLCLYL